MYFIDPQKKTAKSQLSLTTSTRIFKVTIAVIINIAGLSDHAHATVYMNGAALSINHVVIDTSMISKH